MSCGPDNQQDLPAILAWSAIETLCAVSYIIPTDIRMDRYDNVGGISFTLERSVQSENKLLASSFSALSFSKVRAFTSWSSSPTHTIIIIIINLSIMGPVALLHSIVRGQAKKIFTKIINTIDHNPHQ